MHSVMRESGARRILLFTMGPSRGRHCCLGFYCHNSNHRIWSSHLLLRHQGSSIIMTDNTVPGVDASSLFWWVYNGRIVQKSWREIYGRLLSGQTFFWGIPEGFGSLVLKVSIQSQYEGWYLVYSSIIEVWRSVFIVASDYHRYEEIHVSRSNQLRTFSKCNLSFLGMLCKLSLTPILLLFVSTTHQHKHTRVSSTTRSLAPNHKQNSAKPPQNPSKPLKQHHSKQFIMSYPPPSPKEKMSVPYLMAPTNLDESVSFQSSSSMAGGGAAKPQGFFIHDREEKPDFWEQLSGIESQSKITYAIPVIHKPTGRRGTLKFNFSTKTVCTSKRKSYNFLLLMIVFYTALTLVFYFYVKRVVRAQLHECLRTRNGQWTW